MDQKIKNQTDITLLDLFISFLRLGSTAFGGPAMVAYIRKLAVDRKQWLDGEIFRSGVSLCQTIPGATAMQMSAYVGLKARGVTGAAVSFIGFGLPAFIFMVALAVLFKRFSSLPLVISAFSGLHVLIVAIIANATISFGKTSLRKFASFVIAGLAAIGFMFSLHPVIVIGLSAILGLFLTTISFEKQTIIAPPFINTVRPVLFISALIILALICVYFIDRKLFYLGALMMRIDLFAFGGGFASVPLMFHEIVKVRGWLPAPIFMDGIALGQVTPGPVVITATFIGYMMYGISGAVIATASVFAPSFLMLIGMAPYFDRLRSSPRFVAALNGILYSFVGLLAATTIRFAINSVWTPSHLILAVLAFAALFRKIDILWVVLSGIIYSILFG
jgi:chromate transporter